MISRHPVIGAVIAGGQARRMGGGDKCLLPVHGRPILAHIVQCLAPQCGYLLLNTNGDPGRFAAFGLPVVPDAGPDAAGPMAGLLAVLDHLSGTSMAGADLLTVPGDTPFLPPDLVTRLTAAKEKDGTAIACAVSSGRRHPTIALWPPGIREPLRDALAAGELGIGRFASAHGVSEVEWPAPPDPFLNVNTPADLVSAETGG